MRSDHDKFIRMAIGKAERGDSPFGALVVQNGEVVVTAWNTVKTDRDPTAHAELNALRGAVTELGTTNLETCTLYSTVEPCPMCMAAAMHARVRQVVYGASIEEVSEHVPQIRMSSRELAARGVHPVEVIGGVLADLCLVPFRNR